MKKEDKIKKSEEDCFESIAKKLGCDESDSAMDEIFDDLNVNHQTKKEDEESPKKSR